MQRIRRIQLVNNKKKKRERVGTNAQESSYKTSVERGSSALSSFLSNFLNGGLRYLEENGRVSIKQ